MPFPEFIADEDVEMTFKEFRLAGGRFAAYAVPVGGGDRPVRCLNEAQCFYVAYSQDDCAAYNRVEGGWERIITAYGVALEDMRPPDSRMRMRLDMTEELQRCLGEK